MTRDEALDKIKKLLRMRRGGTPEEIETALALAAELARKHGIDLAGVNPDQEAENRNIRHIDSATSARLQWERKFAGLVCQSFFHVTILVRLTGEARVWGQRRSGRYCITFIGTSWDTQIAIFVYEFLIGQFRRSWNTRRGRARNRHAFMHGMYHGICSKLDEQRRNQVSESALILIGRAVALRDAYVKNRFGDTESINTTPDTDAQVASHNGYLAGRDTEIRSGLTDNGKAAPMLADSGHASRITHHA